MMHGFFHTTLKRRRKRSYLSAGALGERQTNGVRAMLVCGIDRGMDVKTLAEVSAFVTKDGSEIRELLAHRNSTIRNQSLAEARLAPGASTQEHYHVKTEEI